MGGLAKSDTPLWRTWRFATSTGARLREILHLRWEHVDVGRGLLLLPDSKAGRKSIVLNRPALEILQTHPRNGSYVSGGSDPERPRTDLKKLWLAVSRRAGLEGVLHRSV
jgi:integrase